ncbi:MAG TPA: protein kinase, partial [Isosphaeraceae bacterium]|nr:protein kinase [Isosphaeraceae bacterium]
NIVAAYSAFRLGESIVFAMEYVSGDDLARLVKAKGPLSVAHATNFVYQAALGLEHAHEKGMVHRDVKPSNLMLCRQGDRAVVKILDFGLAKASKEQPLDHGLTREGQMLGTPDYVAPEQTLDAQKADIRADIYSLGCTLYFLLSGNPPFQGSSLFEVLQAHHSIEARPLSQVRADVPMELASLVARMMAKAPDARFQTPAEVASALVPFFKRTKPQKEDEADGSTNLPRLSLPSSPGVPTVVPETSTMEQVARNANEATSSMPRTVADARPSGLGRTPGWMAAAGAGGALVLTLVAAWALGLGKSSSPEPRSARQPWASGTPNTTLGQLENPRTTESRPGPESAPDDSKSSIALGKVDAPHADAPNSTQPGAMDSTKADRRPLPEPHPDADANRKDTRPDSTSSALDSDPSGVSSAERPAASRSPSPPIVKQPLAIAPRGRPKIGPGPGWIGRIDGSSLMTAPAKSFRLITMDKLRPPGSFWPELSPSNSREWRVADPSAIKMTGKGVQLEEGSGGNFLLTRKSDYRKCALHMALAVEANTEAYLVLRAHQDGGVWHGLTARIAAHGGNVVMGHQSTDFQPDDRGRQSIAKPLNKPFLISFTIDEKHVAKVFVGAERTALVDYAHHPAHKYVGSAGLFVKSGKVLIERLSLSEK